MPRKPTDKALEQNKQDEKNSLFRNNIDKGKQAGIPSLNICMNCHNEQGIGKGEKYGEQAIGNLRKHYAEGKPVQWIRVHNLPDHAYFNHAQHTAVAGLECKNCHGQIDTMEVVQQVKSLTMGWCINCHRETGVNSKDNAYYDKLLKYHNDQITAFKRKGEMKAEHIGALECAKCHY